MDALTIVEAFDVLKQVLFYLPSGCVGTVINSLSFKRVEETCYRGIEYLPA